MVHSKDTELTIRWKELLKREPGMRIRNAAAALGVSEAGLLATRCGDTVRRLRPEFRQILQGVGSLGHVMALSRNDSVVHERHGVYRNFSESEGNIGIYVSEDIDLRIFFRFWESAFAVRERSHNMTRKSIQFFAGDGEAVHKIYLTGESDEAAYEELVAKYLHSDQGRDQEVMAYPAAGPGIPDSEVDVEAFRRDWMALKDTHHFAGLLARYKLERVQALRLAPEGQYAVPVENSTLRRIITEVSGQGLPIMVFVANRGIVQIHTGTVHRLLDRDGWFNIIDPAFSLHVKEVDISESWIVTKPGTDGSVTSLECFNAQGNLLLQVFGKRKPGIPEREDWRELAGKVLEEHRIMQPK
jgi:putative hemin transport protein